MAQILKGDTFVDGQQVTGARLNQLVDSSALLVGSIADQTAMSANDVASTDQILINDGGVLKKTTIGDVLNSNLPATFTSVSVTNFVSDNVAPSANKDLNLSSNAGVAVTGKTFTSVNGINVTVNSTAHNVLQNQVLTITASVSAYSGEYRIVSVTTDTFEYILPTAATPSSGSCDYTKTASVITTGNSVITSDEYLIGNQDVGGNSRTSGNSTINGNLTVKGTADFTGAFQVNGTVGYVLYQVQTLSLPSPIPRPIANSATDYTSPTITKPADEIWVFELQFNLTHNGYPIRVGVRLGTQTPFTGNYMKVSSWHDAGGASLYRNSSFQHKWVIDAGVSFSGTYAIDSYTPSAQSATIFTTSVNQDAIGAWTGTMGGNDFIIYKYKTA